MILFARLVTGFAFFTLYFPLLVMMVLSFLDSKSVPGATVWTLEWYRKVLSDERVLLALQRSLWIGLWSTLGATVIGTAAALAVQRARFRGRGLLDSVSYVPLVMPEIVLGLALLVWFVMVKLPLGTFCVILAHITFSLSYVMITVRSRLKDFDMSLEEAARDLGASPWQTFCRVTFPLIWPSVLSGALIAFTLSFDDFLITFFTAGVGSDTLPLHIYGMIKFGVSPEIHALSTLMIAGTLLLVLLFYRPGKSQIS